MFRFQCLIIISYFFSANFNQLGRYEGDSWLNDISQFWWHSKIVKTVFRFWREMDFFVRQTFSERLLISRSHASVIRSARRYFYTCCLGSYCVVSQPFSTEPRLLGLTRQKCNFTRLLSHDVIPSLSLTLSKGIRSCYKWRRFYVVSRSIMSSRKSHSRQIRL